MPFSFHCSINYKMLTLTHKRIILFQAIRVKAIVILLGAGGIAAMREAVFADTSTALLFTLTTMRIMRYGKADDISYFNGNCGNLAS